MDRTEDKFFDFSLDGATSDLDERPHDSSTSPDITSVSPDQPSPKKRLLLPGDEELSRNLKIFDNYNAHKTSFLYEQLTQRKKAVFDLVPLLIHVSAEGLLNEDKACKRSPYGVFRYEMNQKVEKAFADAFPGKQPPSLKAWASYDPSLPIKSISLIGSLGSLAQNSKSDFDYWICLDGDAFSTKEFEYFRVKLGAIEKWAENFAGAEVHFFPMDLKNIREDNFGAAKGESSGTALGNLLKEEFYRTMTLVAGQVPLWWVMPPEVSDSEYMQLYTLVSHSVRLDAGGLADLGNVRTISLSEYYGAAIWQINKTIGSPFKSVLKMALLDEYMMNTEPTGLLCDDLKRRLQLSKAAVHMLDPYVLMFERASNYFDSSGRWDDLDLLRKSMYLKIGEKLTFADYRQKRLPRKRQAMVEMVQKWGWKQSDIDHLNAYHYWSFRESQIFSQQINSFIFRTYKRITTELKQQQHSGLTISQRDLTVLNRKLFAFYARRPYKVESIKNVIESPPVLTALTIQTELDEQNTGCWAAYRSFLSREKTSNSEGIALMLQRSKHLAHTLIWLVVNRLYGNATSINLNSGYGSPAVHCTVPDIQTLLREMGDFFPAYKNNEISEKELLCDPRPVRMLLVVNLECPDKTQQIAQTAVVYQNNWGEVFFEGTEAPHHGLKLARDFVADHGLYDISGNIVNFRVYIPDRHNRQGLIQRLNKYLGADIL